MLARGVLCHLAANVPQTSTRDLPQLARLLSRTLLSRNARSTPAICALSRAYNTALKGSQRSYSTTSSSSETKPTARVKRDVKKAVAEKPATKRSATKKPAAKKSTKKATAKKTESKKKAAAKPKPKPAKKVLTEEEKQAALIRSLKKTALKQPIGRGALSAYNAFTREFVKEHPAPGPVANQIKAAAQKFNSLNASEREHYNHLANEANAARQKEYQAWVKSHTPEEIRVANLARNKLRALRNDKGLKGISVHAIQAIHDERAPVRPLTSFVRFLRDRHGTGDYKDIEFREAHSLVVNEWKALSADEKAKYEAESAKELAEHKKTYERVYGRKPGARVKYV